MRLLIFIVLISVFNLYASDKVLLQEDFNDLKNWEELTFMYDYERWNKEIQSLELNIRIRS